MTTRCALATPDQDGVLRALLRENAMPSWVSMAMTREPSFFAGANRYGDDWAVIASEGDATAGMYTGAAYPLHLNGQPTRGGYLGGLRVAPAFRHRLRILRAGYASVPRLAPPPMPDVWFTSVACDNQPARRVLEAKLRGMPGYVAVNEFVTLAMPMSRARRHGLWRGAGAADMEALCRFHNRHAGRYQFSPVLTPERAVRTKADFFLLDAPGGLSACMALWNQQGYKQAVATAYREPLGRLLPLYNLYAHLARRIPLPPIGQPLDQTSLAFLATEPSDHVDPIVLVEDALALCRTAVLSVGLHADHPWLGVLMRAFRPAAYRTRLYAVAFGAPPELDGRPAQPELALL